jgi:hypothetical protein
MFQDSNRAGSSPATARRGMLRLATIQRQLSRREID